MKCPKCKNGDVVIDGKCTVDVVQAVPYDNGRKAYLEYGDDGEIFYSDYPYCMECGNEPTALELLRKPERRQYA